MPNRPAPGARLPLVAQVALTAAVVLLAVGCRRPSPRSVRPNLLLITIDTLRADHCSVYGYGRRTTPTLERLARDGALVETAYAPTASTAPSHATLLTSLYPLGHGVLANGMVLPAEHQTLTEVLRSAGYRTSGVVSSFVLSRRFGFGRGFGTFEDAFDKAGSTMSVKTAWEGLEVLKGFDRRADATTDLALGWLSRRGRDRPFFLWVHYFDPHDPYDPPAPFDTRFVPAAASTSLESVVAAYDGEIAFADAQLARLLGALEAEGIAGRTLVAVAGDHGEGLMQHGQMGHGVHLYEEAVRVPLLLRWPGVIPNGLRLSGPAELVDLAPTLLEMAGLDRFPSAVQGTSLAATLRAARGGPGNDPHRMVFLQRRLYRTPVVGNVRVSGEKYAVRAGGWKYVEAEQEGTKELYDLAADATETRNLATQRPDRVAALSGAIAAWRSAVAGKGRATTDTSRETVEALRALGYVQ